jgi:hypothetical protein
VEYHGKTELDGLFGRIKKALKIIRLGVVMKNIPELQEGLTTKFSAYNTPINNTVFTTFVLCLVLYQFFFCLALIERTQKRLRF